MPHSHTPLRAAVDSMEREEQANCEVIDALAITALRRSCYLHSPCHTVLRRQKKEANMAASAVVGMSRGWSELGG